jgi:hypothetical protein
VVRCGNVLYNLQCVSEKYEVCVSTFFEFRFYDAKVVGERGEVSKAHSKKVFVLL